MLNLIVFFRCKDACSWVQIPGKISPLLVFPNYDFNGTQTHNSTLCYKWSGCHYYEVRNKISKCLTYRDGY